MKPKVVIDGLVKEFSTATGTFQAIAPLDVTLREGAFYSVVGPSGCGKTTLLRILGGLESETRGSVAIEHSDPDVPLTSIVFQGDSIFPWMSVYDNIAYGLTNRRVPPREREETVSYWLDLVGLAPFRDAYPHQLSGGMRQRVSVARAFANDPEVLLMDEPFSALDEQNRTLLQQELIRIWEHTGKTVVFVTHSVDEALTLSDEVLLMSASPGRIVDTIPVTFDRPRKVLDIRSDATYAQLQKRIWTRLMDEVDASRKQQEPSS